MLTVKELKVLLEDVPDDVVVVQSKDGEGNGFSPLADITLGRYAADSTWSGQYGISELTPELEADGYSADDVPDGPLAICLWPTN